MLAQSNSLAPDVAVPREQHSPLTSIDGLSWAEAEDAHGSERADRAALPAGSDGLRTVLDDWDRTSAGVNDRANVAWNPEGVGHQHGFRPSRDPRRDRGRVDAAVRKLNVDRDGRRSHCAYA